MSHEREAIVDCLKVQLMNLPGGIKKTFTGSPAHNRVCVWVVDGWVATDVIAAVILRGYGQYYPDKNHWQDNRKD
jgi:hypothetical protein